MRTVLFVCHANTARSVMAHVMLERMLAGRELDRTVRVRSGGVGNVARDGMLPSLDARLALREIGIQLGEDTLTSTDLRAHPEVIASADVVLVMTEDQRRAIRALTDLDGRPVLTLRELAGEAGDIADPAAQGEDVFRSCRNQIGRCLDLGFACLLDLLK